MPVDLLGLDRAQQTKELRHHLRNKWSECLSTLLSELDDGNSSKGLNFFDRTFDTFVRQKEGKSFFHHRLSNRSTGSLLELSNKCVGQSSAKLEGSLSYRPVGIIKSLQC